MKESSKLIFILIIMILVGLFLFFGKEVTNPIFKEKNNNTRIDNSKQAVMNFLEHAFLNYDEDIALELWEYPASFLSFSIYQNKAELKKEYDKQFKNKEKISEEKMSKILGTAKFPVTRFDELDTEIQKAIKKYSNWTGDFSNLSCVSFIADLPGPCCDNSFLVNEKNYKIISVLEFCPEKVKMEYCKELDNK